MQKHNALNILNNRPKFEAIVSECDNILNSINQSSSAPSKPAPGFEEFRQYMDQTNIHSRDSVTENCSGAGIG